MDSETAKGMREKELFANFVTIANLPIDLGTIEKRHGLHEPDILCVHHQDGPLAFELTEICDPNVAEFNNMDKDKVEDGVLYMRTADPTERIIKNKLEKKYRTECPMELLCYTDGRVLTPLNMILLRLRSEAKSLEGGFRRVWLMSAGKVHEVWSEVGGEGR